MVVTWYWASEYIKVLAGYTFLMFIWPVFMLRKYLKGRSITFLFGFCVTFQPVLINTVVIVLGLVHLLNVWVVRGLFYIPFLIEVIKWLGWGKKEERNIKHLLNGTYGMKMFCHNVICGIGRRIRGFCHIIRGRLRTHWWEYGLLSVIIIYGMIYFSWGAFQNYSFGFGDMYTHSAWIYGLVEGQIFSAGVYPEGMHCFIYGMHTLFGIRLYSCQLFLAGIHLSAFFLAAYILMKVIFHWKYTPMFVLAAFLTLDVVCIDEIYGMSRLQWMLPMEFGLHSVFLCAAFLVRYLYSEKRMIFRGKPTRGYWDENLLVFALSLAASLTIHFYSTIMAFFLCLAFVPVHMKKIFSRKRFMPLFAAVATGFVVAVLPMAGAYATGIPLEASLHWAMSVIEGAESQTQSQTQQQDAAVTEEPEAQGGLEDAGESEEVQGLEGTSAGSQKEPLKDRALRVLERAKTILQEKLITLYQAGYVTLYRAERAEWIVAATALASLIWLVVRLMLMLAKCFFKKRKIQPGNFDHYLSITFASVIFMAMYCAHMIGLPYLIAGSRLCSMEQMLILAMMAVPLDLVFSVMHLAICEGILKIVSAFVVAGIYIGTIMTGSFHGFLYYEWTRYNGAVLCTHSIISTMPEYSYTVISPTDELYQMIQYGYHEELLNFANQVWEKEYRLPSEHIFIFLEKKPILYAQYLFASGPEWLAREKYLGYYGLSFPVSQRPGYLCAELMSAEELGGERYEFELGSQEYGTLNRRALAESVVYQWCQAFSTLYPGELQTYYEDEQFICYYIRQNPQSLYQLGIFYQEETE